jgi:putative polyketide hydroxylase
MSAETSTKNREESFEVVVVGAGPVGLVSAIQLGRAGIETLLLERRATFSTHPKSGGIHARTMEIYRQLGISDLIQENGRSSNGVLTLGWMTSLNGIEIGSISIGATEEERDRFRAWSPETMVSCTQDIYEPILGEVVGRYPSVSLRMASEATALAQDDDWVTIGYSDAEGEKVARARYVIGADGVRSPVRRRLGIGESGVEPLGNSINVVFDADLEPYRAGRDYGLFWVLNAKTHGAFGSRKSGTYWSYNFTVPAGGDPASYTPEHCIEIIRAAIGVPDVPIRIVSTLHWKLEQAVTYQWRAGRVFLAGDASHRFPPHGGFGMNSGVQDSHNLVWKLIARLRWGAGDKLLDSYEVERKPIAEQNGEQCLLNTRRLASVGGPLKDAAALATIDRPEGEALREKIRTSLPAQREQILSQGQQFGQIYRSGALIDDGTPIEESTVSTYRPSGHPGARAPHFWLADGRSTIDLYDGGFVLFVARDGQPWLGAAASVARAIDVPLSAFHIGGPGCDLRPGGPQWEDLVGVSAEGALLIRPDGYVAARWTALPDDPASALKGALEVLLNFRGS